MKRYLLEKQGKLFFTRGMAKGIEGLLSLRFLVDTGSTYTILPWEGLEAIGYTPAESKDRVRIITADGYIVAPRVRIEWLSALGNRIDEFQVVVHSLPSGIYAKGLLGMDFLSKIKAIIYTHKGLIKFGE